MAPTKENTLCLTIEKINFDEILAGTKKHEHREIKDTNFEKHLSTWRQDNIVGIHFNEDLLSENFYKHPKHPMVYNDGVYPFCPIPYKFLKLSLGNNDDCDRLLVKVEDIHFKPLITEHGKEARFNMNGNQLQADDNGDLCTWHIVYQLGEIVEANLQKDLLEIHMNPL